MRIGIYLSYKFSVYQLLRGDPHIDGQKLTQTL